MKYPLVIFDWDGTLMDSTGRIVSCLRQAAADLQLPALPDERLRSIIGLGLPEAIAALWPLLGVAEVEQMRARYADHFIAAEHTPSPLYPGGERLLQQLRQAGVTLAVATGKSRKGLQRVWDNTGLGRYFHASRCADESHSKPHPAMVQELLMELAFQPGEALVVGDTSFDMEMARAAGVARLAVSFGAHPVERLMPSEPIAVIDRLEDVLSWVTDANDVVTEIV